MRRSSEIHLEAWIKTERRLFWGTAIVALLLAGYWWLLDPVRRSVLERVQIDESYSGAATIFAIEPITAIMLSAVAIWRAQQVDRLRRQLPGIDPQRQRVLGAFCLVIALLSLVSGLLFHMNAFFFLALLFFGVAARSQWRIGQLTKLQQSA